MNEPTAGNISGLMKVPCDETCEGTGGKERRGRDISHTRAEGKKKRICAVSPLEKKRKCPSPKKFRIALEWGEKTRSKS